MICRIPKNSIYFINAVNDGQQIGRIIFLEPASEDQLLQFLKHDLFPCYFKYVGKVEKHRLRRYLTILWIYDEKDILCFHHLVENAIAALAYNIMLTVNETDKYYKKYIKNRTLEECVEHTAKKIQKEYKLKM